MSDKKNNLRNDELQHSERGRGKSVFEINENIKKIYSAQPNLTQKGNRPSPINSIRKGNKDGD